MKMKETLKEMENDKSIEDTMAPDNFEVKEEITYIEKILGYIKLMRVKHYIKNFLIFLPLIFSLNFSNFQMDITVLIGFIIFSFTCSIVYIINDVQDVEKDRNHPEKSKRPIASGKVSIKEAYVLAFILLVVVAIIGISTKINCVSMGILVFYLLLNVAYTKKLKNVPIVDVVILVACFVLRVIYGASLIDVAVSNWLYLTIISFSFYLSLGKRRNELEKSKSTGVNVRAVLKFYNKDFLDKNMYLCLALTIAFYSLWCVAPINIEKFGTNYLVFTVPLVMIICMKYSLNIEGNSYGDPVEVLLSDKILLILVLLYVLIMGMMILI